MVRCESSIRLVILLVDQKEALSKGPWLWLLLHIAIIKLLLLITLLRIKLLMRCCLHLLILVALKSLISLLVVMSTWLPHEEAIHSTVYDAYRLLRVFHLSGCHTKSWHVFIRVIGH